MFTSCSIYTVKKFTSHRAKATEGLSGICCRVHARERFAKLHKGLRNSVRNFQTRSVFPNIRKRAANKQESRAFSFFAYFSGKNKDYLVIFPSARFSGTSASNCGLKCPAGHQRTFGENHFFIGDGAMVLQEAPARETCCDYASCFCYWLATSSSRKYLVSRFWRPTTDVWRTPPPDTPHQERASISRAVVFACEELQLFETYSCG